MKNILFLFFSIYALAHAHDPDKDNLDWKQYYRLGSVYSEISDVGYSGYGRLKRTTTFTFRDIRFFGHFYKKDSEIRLRHKYSRRFLSIDNIYSYENELTKYAYEQLQKNNDIKLYGDFNNQTSIISFNIDGLHFNDLAMFLDKKNIAIRTGHHCCQPLMKHLNVTGTSRISFGVYNTKDDVDYLLDSLHEITKILL